MSRLDEAELFLREALEKKRKVRGENHPDTLVSLNNLGVLLQSQNKQKEAEQYFRSAMEKCRVVLGPEHPNTLITTINTGFTMLILGQAQEALDLLTSVEIAAHKVFTGSYASWLGKCLLNIGRARTRLEQFATAKPTLLEAHATLLTLRGPEHRDTRGCMQALIDLYTAWHGKEPAGGHDVLAAEWQAKLAALPAVVAPDAARK